jgi:Rrf2 family protein
MSLLPRKGLLAIAAVIDVALNARGQPVAAKALASRHRLPPRHLEPVLQALVRQGVLKGVRGPRGGYELARERRKITVGEIVRTVAAMSAADPEESGAASRLVKKVIEPSVRKAGESFLANLDAITIEDLCAAAIAARILEDEQAGGDFAI